MLTLKATISKLLMSAVTEFWYRHTGCCSMQTSFTSRHNASKITIITSDNCAYLTASPFMSKFQRASLATAARPCFVCNGYFMRRDQIDILPYMAAFAIVVEVGSFIEASDVLGITASAVSRQVSKLERALSLRLLERSTRHLRLNNDGERVYDFCKKILESSSQIFELKEQLHNEPKGIIRIAAPRLLIPALSEVIPSFLTQYPLIDVQSFFSGFSESDNNTGTEMDIILKLSAVPPSNFIARKLTDVRRSLYASSQYLECHGLPTSVDKLALHSFIKINNRVDEKEWHFKSDDRTCSFEVSSRYSANDYEAALNAAIGHLGIVALPRLYARAAVREGLVVPVLVDWQLIDGGEKEFVWFLYNQNKYGSLKVKAAVEYLIKHLRLNLEID
ncbi:LysR family transcriptional regulator [Pseudomonas syringae]|uniref:LysR family transcriptional regulator n=1 Tax=Pseudomonas syringae TaxID=317 RepID=UPI001268C17A|nr:LysR family transcriptional regulator [Pseudomonas syringae]UOF20637.1 LysR family transcriptional regulator [Pseudomonas syringae CC440]UZA78199.1 LysR family transcriptional regulator [Pseudomonas syringae]